MQAYAKASTCHWLLLQNVLGASFKESDLLVITVINYCCAIVAPGFLTKALSSSRIRIQTGMGWRT